MLNGLDYLWAALAALAAGAVNALAGGGTLITFPILTFLGLPAVAANVTNTVALCPGYFGGTLAQWNDLKTQKNRLWLIVPASIVGGVVGGYLLLMTGEKLFKELVPYLILLASGLLAAQDPPWEPPGGSVAGAPSRVMFDDVRHATIYDAHHV